MLAGEALRENGAAAGIFLAGGANDSGDLEDVEHVEGAVELVAAGSGQFSNNLFADDRLDGTTVELVQEHVRIVGDEVAGLFGDLDRGAGFGGSLLDCGHLLDFVGVEDVGFGFGEVAPLASDTVAVAVVLDGTLGGLLSANGVGTILLGAGHRVSFQKF